MTFKINVWERNNVTTGQYRFFLFVVKCLKKLFSIIFIITLMHTILYTKINRVFVWGILQKKSCLVNEIHQELKVRAVFLDIFKAFEKVWRDGFIFKLKQNGVSVNNRKKRVVLNGSYSKYSIVESGVSQGSILVLLLFLIYINDLEKNLILNIFAHDTMLFQ